LPKNIETEVKEQGTGTENREPEERYKIRYINNQSFIKTLHKTEEESEDSSDESSMDYQSYSDNEDSFICSPIPKKETPISLSIILYAPDNHKQQITIAELYNKSMHKMPLIIMKEAKRFNYPKITKKPCLDQFKPITIEHIPQFLGKTQKVEKSLSYLLQ